MSLSLEYLMNISDRLNTVLYNITEDDNKAIIADMDDQSSRMKALHNCRGPCVGWDDYIAGRDYQPPMYFKSDQPYGPKDTGKLGIRVKEADQLQFDGPNPFSIRHGGVRPWAPGEVLLTLISNGPNRESNGSIQMIARKGAVSRAALATHGKYDEDDIDNAIQQGAAAVIQALPGDEARKGTRFTSFIGTAIQQGMKAGVPSGYQDEYRKIRGLRRKLTTKVKAALRDALNGEPLETYIRDIRIDFAHFDRCPKCNGDGKIKTKEIDPRTGKNKTINCPTCGGVGTVQPGPRHPYGIYPPVLMKIKEGVLRAITTGNAKAIQKALDEMNTIFNEIEEKEDLYFSPGLTTQGAVGTKPREHGTLIAFDRAAKVMQAQRDLALRAAATQLTQEDIDTLIKQSDAIWDKFTKVERKVPWKAPKDDPTKKEPRYHSPYENALPDPGNIPGSDLVRANLERNISPGFIGLLPLKAKLEEAIKSGDKVELEKFISLSETQQQLLRNREQLKTKEIGAASMTVRNKETGKEQERSNFSGIERDVDAVHDPAVQEMVEMTIARVSPWSDSSLERKQVASEADEILTAIVDLVADFINTKSEGLDTKPVVEKMSDLYRDINDSLGEYEEELRNLLDMVVGTIKIGGGFGDIKKEFKLTKQLINQDVKAKPSADVVNERQYRLLLRIFGIRNYPERGTPNDPEIGEHGELSRWAQAGYPACVAAEAGKAANAFMWYDVFETTDPKTGEPKPSASDAYISRQKGEALTKFTAAAGKVRQQIGESLGVESVDYKMLTEFHLLLCRIVIEDVLPGVVKLIRG